MVDYTENLNRIVGVQWAEDFIAIVSSATNAPLNNWEIVLNKHPDSPVPSDVSVWRHVMRGETSGAQLDLRLIQEQPSPGGISNTAFPDCERIWIRSSNINGVTLTNEDFTVGYSIGVLANGFAFATAIGVRGLQAGASACEGFGSKPAYPAFTVGERVTKVSGT